MLPDRVLNPGPLTYESGALPIVLRSPAKGNVKQMRKSTFTCMKVELFLLMVLCSVSCLQLTTILDCSIVSLLCFSA